MASNQLHPESYSGLSGGLKKSTVWLASEDVGLDVELVVTIVDVERHRGVEFDKGRKEDVAALKFAELEKRMVLNATNRKFCARLFGMDTGNWRKQRVALYVDPDVKMAGQKVNGLRMRPAPDKAVAELCNLPAAWSDWGNQERGDFIARRGTEQFRVWWKTLSKADQTALSASVDGWKDLATAATG